MNKLTFFLRLGRYHMCMISYFTTYSTFGLLSDSLFKNSQFAFERSLRVLDGTKVLLEDDLLSSDDSLYLSYCMVIFEVTLFEYIISCVLTLLPKFMV